MRPGLSAEFHYQQGFYRDTGSTRPIILLSGSVLMLFPLVMFCSPRTTESLSYLGSLRRKTRSTGGRFMLARPGVMGSGASCSAVRYYEYDRSRAQAVVKRILGGQFAGHLVSDFYAGYNDYADKKQRCWVHLLRDLHALKAAHPYEAAAQAWTQAVRACYDTAQAWVRANAQAPPSAREAQYVTLSSQIHGLGRQYARSYKHPCCALAKRLLRHEDEPFQFVLVEGLSVDNNLAEQAIRPLVVIRKVNGGSRSAAGTKTRMALASLFQSGKRGLNPFEQCLALLSQPVSV